MKPNYSSFKLGGIRVRGKNAAILQSTFLAFRFLYICLNFYGMFQPLYYGSYFYH